MSKKTFFITTFVLIPVLVGCAIYRLNTYGFIRNYLPDFLWSFSFTSSILIIWGTYNILWLILTLIVGTAFEALQRFDLLPGIADPFDVLTYLIGFFISIFTFKIYEYKKAHSVRNNP